LQSFAVIYANTATIFENEKLLDKKTQEFFEEEAPSSSEENEKEKK